MSNDPTSTSATPARPSPGWYPDPSGESQQRWWDGDGWTAQTYNPAVVAAVTAPKQVAAGTPVYTPWIWLIVALPLLGLISLFFFDFEAYLRSSLEQSLAQSRDPTAIPDPFAGTSQIFTPAYFAQAALGWVSYFVGVLFAFLDWRALKQRGFDRPFHWAWAFVPWSLVYVIGRSVIVNRRAGSGLAPIWSYVAISVLTVVVSFVVLGVVLANVLPEVMPAFTTAP